MIDAAAFDQVAAGYDSTFTDTVLGRMLRERVWKVLAAQARPEQRVLELACGTGEDAVWLAQRGVEVVATDGAPGMVQIAQKKAEQAGVADRVNVYHCSLQELSGALPDWATELDGVFSNFGGLNAIGEWRPLAESLARQMRPDGWVLLVVMGQVCPWEIGWHLLHGQVRQAGRRLQGKAPAGVGEQTITVWYPSPQRLAKAFAPWFYPREIHSLGFWLPPAYLGHLVARLPRLARAANRLERVTARFTAGWGDHYLILLEKRL